MGIAIGINPGYLKLRKIRAAQNIARTVNNRKSAYNKLMVVNSLNSSLFQIAASQNRVYLNADSLMINVSDVSFDERIATVGLKKDKK